MCDNIPVGPFKHATNGSVPIIHQADAVEDVYDNLALYECLLFLCLDIWLSATGCAIWSQACLLGSLSVLLEWNPFSAQRNPIGHGTCLGPLRMESLKQTSQALRDRDFASNPFGCFFVLKNGCTKSL